MNKKDGLMNKKDGLMNKKDGLMNKKDEVNLGDRIVIWKGIEQVVKPEFGKEIPQNFYLTYDAETRNLSIEFDHEGVRVGVIELEVTSNEVDLLTEVTRSRTTSRS